ncbi:MAG TPA: Gmad2 immunoglobulin-like domain-containing protein [Dehalococcoidia bacterium]|nr:Gmad2 immunoglobulin-like domain-containing protein [Dehalococcoidia bacterium]
MKTLLAALACIFVILSAAACGDDDDDDTSTSTSTPTTSATTPAATTAAATSPAVSATPLDVCLPNPDPATPDVNNVTAPSPFDEVTSPVQVTGQIAVFEAQFNITIYDAQGNKIADQPAMSNEGQTLAPFSASVPFTVSEETPACIWVYDISEADGVTLLNVVQIPVTLLP